MPVTFEEAEKNLHQLADWYQNSAIQSRNEATTRLQLINRIITECLGWDLEDCKAEESSNGQYIDYSLYCPSCLLIIEAKKEDTYFELPLGSTNLKCDIGYFLRHAKDVGGAIQQAIGYCQKRGTPYGAICNGHQIIAFIGSRSDGYSPIEGKALAFDSYDMMEQHFLILWQCLSKEGIMNRRLSVELSDVITAPIPEKLSQQIPGYPGFKQRNTLQTDLQILSDLFLEDLASIGEEGGEVDFIKECYCQSGALSQYALVSREILKTRYSNLFQKETEGPSLAPATTKKGINPQLIADSLSRRPVLLIGDVGVGKTMFIKHLYQVEAADLFSDALAIYVDFAYNPTLEKDLELFIQDSVESQLRDNYEIDIRNRNFVFGVLNRELQQFENGIYGDLRNTAPETYERERLRFVEDKMRNIDEYLRRCLNHIQRGRKKQIVLFLDNVDRRSEELQERVFVIGQGIAERWPVTVFISIRPETFYKSRSSGALDAYHPRAFTISPPRVDQVVQKRLVYGINLLERGMQLGFGDTITVKTETLRNYLNILIYSFDKNRYLIEFLDNMCGGNIRLALDFVRAFIGSGHVDTGKILNKYEETGSYLVPLHEFLRAIIYGDHEHYSPVASHILNLFDVSCPDGKEHFLSPILLAQLVRWSQNSTTDGFVNVSDIFAYLQDLGYTPKQINWALERLSNRNLIELPVRLQKDNEHESVFYYRVTSIGAYYVRRLIGRFNYVDGMVVDTPILEPSMQSRISDAYSIQDRLARARIFCEYLDSQWSLVQNHELAFRWPAVREAITRNIEYITGKISIREDVLEPMLPSEPQSNGVQ